MLGACWFSTGCIISSSYEFVGTCEYYSWFLATRLDQLSPSSSAPFPPLFPLDLVSPLSVEQRPDVRRGVHHAGEAELALVGLLCCLVRPAFLAFVWLWPTVKIKVFPFCSTESDFLIGITKNSSFRVKIESS